MNAKDTTPGRKTKTLVDVIRYFSDPTVALNFFVNLRWPEGVYCPHCGSTNVLFMAKYSRWKCREGHARPQFTVKVGTVMEESPLSLDKWAIAFWLEANAKNSISSYEVHRALGITQKSAWFMQHRIRLAMQTKSLAKMSGEVEADETYIGGLARNMHKHKRAAKIKGTGGSGKTAVMGLLERHSEKGKSKVRTKIITNTTRQTMHGEVHANVEPGAALYTDALSGYSGLETTFSHQFVDHVESYVRGSVHTNGLENFWALFKRCIKGTHVSVEPYHLTAYLDAEAFRFNNRAVHDGDRFEMAMQGMIGKRLTYKQLISANPPEGVPSSEGGASEGLAN